MKLTTLLHIVDPAQFRTYAFKTYLIAFMRQIYYFMFVTICLIYFGSYQNTVVAVAIAFFSFGSMPFALAYRLTGNKMLVKNSRGVFDRRRLLEFTDEGMLIRYDTGSNSFTVWNDLEFAKYQDQIVRIFVTRQIVHIVPDKAWPSAVERDKFLALLREKGLLKAPK